MMHKAEVPRSFDRAAKTYDLLTLLNPGYRKHLEWSAKRLELGPRARVLDLCCGTGASTQALMETYLDATFVGLDGSKEMLEVAKRKLGEFRVAWHLGDATDPKAAGVDGSFDAVFMAYGIRNVEDPDHCLRNIFELLNPGGNVCFHEYSVADSMTRRLIWNAVSAVVIVPLGSLVSGSKDLYRYLRQSVNQFDRVPTFEERLRRTGFVDVHTEPMDGWQRGIVHSFLARKP